MTDKTCTTAQRSAIAARARTAREMAGLSQGQVAKLLGLHRPSVSEIEAGRRRISADELARLAEIYGVSISWLACVEDERDDAQSDRVELAARELAKLSPQDLERLMGLLRAMHLQRGEPE